MNPLPHPNSLHLQAAHGWLELGDHLEANKDLEKITPSLRSHPDVLKVRWEIYAKEKKWEACVNLTQAIIKLTPEDSWAWVHRAYSLRRAEGEGLEAAMDALLPSVSLFPEVWTIPYNLACYCSQLGRLEEAQEWFKKSMALNEEVKRIAIDDPDLQPLWDSMSGSVWKRI